MILIWHWIQFLACHYHSINARKLNWINFTYTPASSAVLYTQLDQPTHSYLPILADIAICFFYQHLFHSETLLISFFSQNVEMARHLAVISDRTEGKGSTLFPETGQTHTVPGPNAFPNLKCLSINFCLIRSFALYPNLSLVPILAHMEHQL